MTHRDEQNEKPDALELPTLEDFTEKEVKWLIHGYIPENQLTILAASGGVGKGTVWTSIAAGISSGKGTILNPQEVGDPRRVLFFSAEDTVEEVIKKRLRKNGANMSNIYTLDMADDRFPRVKIGNRFFEQLIDRYRPALCILDPFQSFIDPNARMAERNQMRKALAPLQKWATVYGCTFLVVMHCNKMMGAYGKARISDSADMWDISRSVLMMGETEDKQRYISHEKSNYGRLSRTVIFDIVDGVPVFKEKTDMKDRDYIQLASKAGRETGTNNAIQECSNALLSILAEHNGEMKISDLDELLANAWGFKKDQIRKAKESLREGNMITAEKTGFGGAWCMKRKL